MSESIGAALRAARERRQLTVAQVSEATRIRTPYLQALENDDLSAMPSVAQGRGFMRIYAQFLGLNLQALIPPAASVPAAPPVAETPAATAPKPALSDLLRRVRERIAPRGAGDSEVTADASATTGDAPPASAPAPEAGPLSKKKAARG
ncbi:MAG: helix-turn-helix transcriptional regulator [Chloroflexota bacterium]